MSIRSYRDLKVWQKAMDLAVEAYGITRSFPDWERYGLNSQLQRSGVSVPSNVAEGHAIGLKKPFKRHLRIANGSLAKMETDVLLAERLHYIDQTRVDVFLERTSEVRRMIYGLRNALDRNS
jgi:four helix bundle protein